MVKKALIRESVKLYSKNRKGTLQMNERVVEDNYKGGKDTAYSITQRLGGVDRTKRMSTQNKSTNPSRYDALKGSFNAKAPSKFKSKK